MTYPPQQPGGWTDPWSNPQQEGQSSTPAGSQPAGSPPAGSPPAGSPGPGYASPSPYPTAPMPAYAPPPYGYVAAPPRPPTNGLAIAALVVACVGVLGLCAYGLGGWIGAIGAILGHVSRRQIRERADGGDGMALAGIIVGWIATGLFVLAGIGWGIFIWYVANHPEDFESSSTFMQLVG